MKTIYKIAFLLLIGFSSCESESADPNPTNTNTPTNPTNGVEDDQVTFTKNNNANPNDVSNQDRITDNVWITRGNDGGQIFNIKVNSSYNKNNSPVGTAWAIGDKENRENLTFGNFRSIVKPKEAVGRNLVVHLIEDDIYLNIRFTSWSSDRTGGFAYVRDAVPE